MTTLKITPVSQENKGRFNRRSILIDLTAKKPSFYKFIYNGTTDTGKDVVVYLFSKNTVFVQYAKGWNTSKGWGNQYGTLDILPEGSFRYVWDEKGNMIADYDAK